MNKIIVAIESLRQKGHVKEADEIQGAISDTHKIDGLYNAIQNCFIMALQESYSDGANTSFIGSAQKQCLSNLEAYDYELKHNGDSGLPPSQNKNWAQVVASYKNAYDLYMKPYVETNARLAEATKTVEAYFFNMEMTKPRAAPVKDNQNIMRDIQTLINEKLGREAVVVNGALNDKLTYSIIESSWGAKAGRDYKNYAQLLALLQKEMPLTTSNPATAARKNELLALANRLDAQGLFREADEVMEAVAALNVSAGPEAMTAGIAATYLSKVAPAFRALGPAASVINVGLTSYSLTRAIMEGAGIDDAIQNVLDPYEKSRYKQSIQMIYDLVGAADLAIQQNDMEKVAEYMGRGKAMCKTIWNAQDANSQEKQQGMVLWEQLDRADKQLADRLSAYIKRSQVAPVEQSPVSAKMDSKAAMKAAQVLINATVGASTVEENGNLGDRKTYEVLSSKFGLVAGRDFHNYDQMLAALKTKVEAPAVAVPAAV